MELAELHRTIHGRTAEREVASGLMYEPQDKKSTDLTDVTNVRSGPPWAGPSSRLRDGGTAGRLACPVHRTRYGSCVHGERTLTHTCDSQIKRTLTAFI